MIIFIFVKNSLEDNFGGKTAHNHCHKPAKHHFSALSTSPKMLPNFSSKDKIPKLYEGHQKKVKKLR